MRATLRYCEQFQLTIANASAPFEYVFRANSIYDPNYTSTGHQPLAHDQLQTLYGRYLVTGSRIRVNVASNSGINDCVTGVVRVDDDATFLNDAFGEVEQSNAAWYAEAGRMEKAAQTLATAFNPRTYFGSKYDSDTCGAAFGANPSQEAFFHLFFAQSGTSAYGAWCTVVIEYDVEVTEPKELLSS